MAKPENIPPNRDPFKEVKALDPAQRLPIPGHGACFVCGDENAKGIGVRFSRHGDYVVSEFALGVHQQGAPSLAHGGSLASILDEAMGMASWFCGKRVMSGRLEIDYHKPVPLNEPLLAIAWVGRQDGRKIWAEGGIYDAEGQRLAGSRALFIEANKNFGKPRLTV